MVKSTLCMEGEVLTMGPPGKPLSITYELKLLFHFVACALMATHVIVQSTHCLLLVIILDSGDLASH